MTIKVDEDLAVFSTLAKVKGAGVARLAIVGLFVLGALILTMAQPDWIVGHFTSTKGSDSQLGGNHQFLPRLWIFASMLATFVVTAWINVFELDKKTEEQIELIVDASRKTHAARQRGWYRGLSLAIVLLTFVLFVIVWIPSFHLAILNLLSGVCLVLLVLFFDILIARVDALALKDLQEQEKKVGDGRSKKRAALEEKITNAVCRLRVSKDVVTKLDLPILIGVGITWVVGHWAMPTFIPDIAGIEVGSVFGHGFATGATAMQLLVANLIFEMIQA